MDRQPWAIMSVKTVTEGKDWRSYYSWAYVLFVLVFPLVCVCGEATDSVRTRHTHTHTRFACLSSQSIPLQGKLMLSCRSPPLSLSIFSLNSTSLSTQLATGNWQLLSEPCPAIIHSDFQFHNFLDFGLDWNKVVNEIGPYLFLKE